MYFLWQYCYLPLLVRYIKQNIDNNYWVFNKILHLTVFFSTLLICLLSIGFNSYNPFIYSQFSDASKFYNVVLIILFFTILALPTLDNIFGFAKNIELNLKENRLLAPLPKARRANGKLNIKRFPEQFTPHYQDHFGFRNVVIGLGSRFILSNNISTVDRLYFFGQQDWLYINEFGQVKDILGLVPFKKYQLKEIVDNLYQNWQFLKTNNIDYLFVVVSNKQTIYPEYLPRYMSNVVSRSKPVTRLEQIMAELLHRYPDFPILDLRKKLLKVKRKAFYMIKLIPIGVG